MGNIRLNHIIHDTRYYELCKLFAYTFFTLYKRNDFTTKYITFADYYEIVKVKSIFHAMFVFNSIIRFPCFWIFDMVHRTANILTHSDTRLPPKNPKQSQNTHFPTFIIRFASHRLPCLVSIQMNWCPFNCSNPMIQMWYLIRWTPSGKWTIIVMFLCLSNLCHSVGLLLFISI